MQNVAWVQVGFGHYSLRYGSVSDSKVQLSSTLTCIYLLSSY